MSRKSFGWLLASSSFLLVAVGCAVGTDDTEVMEGSLASTPVEAGADDDDNSIVLPPPTTSPTEEEEDDDAGTGGADAGSDAAPGGGQQTGGTNVACNAPTTCFAGPDLGAVSGDTSSATLSAEGTTSQWFRVWVTEDDDNIAGKSLRLTASLTSPPGANFDLYLYTGSSSAQECTAVSAQSTNGAGTDTASVTFGESGIVANGSNDSRYVTVEVRHVSGTCSTNAKWSLAVSGN